MLDVQIKALKSSMESKELVTKFELNNQINQLTEQCLILQLHYKIANKILNKN